MIPGATARSRKAIHGIAFLACMQAWWAPAAAGELYDLGPVMTDPLLFTQTAAQPVWDLSPPEWADSAAATEIADAKGGGSEPDPSSDPSILSLPYGFYNESFGVAGAYVYAKNNYPQRDSMVLGTVMAGTQGSVLGFLMGRNLPIPQLERVFVDPILSLGYFGENDVYIDGNPDFPNERAGINDSDEDNFVEGDGIDIFFRARFKYLLPIGHGRDQIIPDYSFDRGLLVGGAGDWEEPSGESRLNCLRQPKLVPFFG